jgi:hypothetical protein
VFHAGLRSVGLSDQIDAAGLALFLTAQQPGLRNIFQPLNMMILNREIPGLLKS